ncbi:MAG: MotA/TolQ/ExbB proton channel family protein [Gammaproteobacteria bacterium]|nr:MotA/TolQ/ExbB proton channel family protein [Gammaproteobacteria bacterium]
MIELFREGGWIMWPILLCSVVALGIVLERLWVLRVSRVCPEHLLAEVWLWVKAGKIDEKKVEALRRSSPLGQVLAAGLSRHEASRDLMKEAVEDTGRHVVHELGRHLNTLGTIAAISPLLGLLGSVLGIMRVFSGISATGAITSQVLSGGIAEALITTAAGIMIAVPSLILYRYFRGKVDDLVVRMEADAIRLIETLGKLHAEGKEAARPRKKTTRSSPAAKKGRRVA